MTISTVQIAVRAKFLRMQRMVRYVETELFQEAYINAKDVTVAIQLIESLEVDKLKLWVEEQFVKGQDYDELPMMKLRNLAHNLGIPYYYNMTKDSLLSEVSRYANRDSKVAQ